ncbi:restriction endonuclease subunit S [Alteromonas sp. 14N.309.X.WAT.G.H12]|uniref:restriction endonuclease subunit S n=1 Tax=Alteromonas sp. 14N.309.X.WAT.G.H12 TaxID=3120824 RepID=UPI002FD171CC
MEKLVVPDGYKQTEIGVIPDNWKIYTVGDAFSICNNLRFPLSTKVREGMQGNYPYYGPTRIQDYLNEYRVEGEFALIGEDGDHFIKFTDVPQTQLAQGKFNVNNHAHLIQGKIGSAKWFFLFFRHRDITSHISRQGAGRYKLNKATLEKLLCAVPCEKEQNAIANVLSDVDALIAGLEKLIAKKQAIKTATMQQLLTGRTRLPEFANHPDGTPKGYKQTELGEIPDDWEVVELGDIGNPIIGLTYSPNNVSDEGTLVLRSSNVQNGRLEYKNNVFVNMDLPERVIVKEGDILVCVRNGSKQLIGKCALIDKEAEGNAFGAFMSIFRTKNSSFVFYQFQSSLIQNQISEIMGATINQITNKDMSGFKISIPSQPKEQTAIANILSDMDEEIQSLQQRLDKTRQIKQGMMQELLTGKTRLV